MSNLLATLGESAGALDLFQRALNTVQSNVTNASTPGYARQIQRLEAAPFDPGEGLIGGVRDAGIESARTEYGETAVRTQASSLGFYQGMSGAVGQIERVFDVTGNGGVPNALSQLFQSFSAWSVTPNDGTARQTVLEQAGQVAQAFNQTASQLTQARGQVENDIYSTVDQINTLAARIADYNRQVRNGQDDQVLDARLYSSLEELSQYVDFTMMRENDGTATVLLGGQIPLVMGDSEQAVPLRAEPVSSATPANPGATPPIHVFAGRDDLDPFISQGKLSGLLEVRNEVIPSILGDTDRAGSLNTLAATFATRVNDLLTAGQVSPGGAAGVPLFAFDSTGATTPPSAVSAAANIRVNPAITAAQLAAFQPATATTPDIANGVALALSHLGSPSSDDDRIAGVSYTEYYAGIAAAIGNKSANAKDQTDLYTQMAAQARNLRKQMSGVSLDEEAAMLIQFQRSYQAVARIVSTLNDLTEVAVNLGR